MAQIPSIFKSENVKLSWYTTSDTRKKRQKGQIVFSEESWSKVQV